MLFWKISYFWRENGRGRHRGAKGYITIFHGTFLSNLENNICLCWLKTLDTIPFRSIKFWTVADLLCFVNWYTSNFRSGRVICASHDIFPSKDRYWVCSSFDSLSSVSFNLLAFRITGCTQCNRIIYVTTLYKATL